MEYSEIEPLFERTLIGEENAEDAWAAIGLLQMSGLAEVFERASQMDRVGGREETNARGRHPGTVARLRRPSLPG